MGHLCARHTRRMRVFVLGALVLLLGVSALFASADAATVKIRYCKELTIPVGESVSIGLTTDSQKQYPATYASRNTKIAAVDSSGRVTGKSAGTTTVITRILGRSLLTKVIVVKTPTPQTTSSPQSSDPQAVDPLQPTPTPASKLIDVPGTFISVGDELALVNEQRAAKGIAPLTVCDELERTAQLRAYESSLLFSHTRPDGSNALDLIRQALPDTASMGENLAMAKTSGSTSAKYIVGMWMASQGHRKNILNKDFSQIAMAAYVSPKGGVYWSQLFVGY